MEVLPTAVLCEADLCCSRQPVILTGDLDADSQVIPSLAKGISDERWVDMEKKRLQRDVAKPLPSLAGSSWMKVTRRDFTWVCSSALSASASCRILPDRWFPPYFGFFSEVALAAGDAKVSTARTFSPLWFA